MASVKNIEVSNYCDRVYEELSCAKEKLLGFMKEIETMTGPEKEMLTPHIKHFEDIVKTIDWKLEILLRVCPLDWAGYAGAVEKAPIFLEPGEELVKEFAAGGYLGG